LQNIKYIICLFEEFVNSKKQH